MNAPSLRRTLLASCGLLSSMALVVILVGVIPSLKNDRFPAATPEAAAVGLWFIVVASLFAAMVFARSAFLTTHSGWSWRLVTTLAEAIVLLFGLGLVDGALACWGHGPAMHLASALMFTAAGCELTAAGLGFVAVLTCSTSQNP